MSKMKKRRGYWGTGLGLMGLLATTHCGTPGAGDGGSGGSLGGTQGDGGKSPVATGGKGPASGGEDAGQNSGGAQTPSGGARSSGGAGGEEMGGEMNLAGSQSHESGGATLGTGGSGHPLELGVPCDSSIECESGHCADGVCCDASCGTTCMACTNDKTGESDGTCAPIPFERDPDEECAVDGLSCRLGFCDGQGQCALPAEGTVCRAVSGPCDVEETCSAGECSPDVFAQTSSSCAPFQCTGTSAECRTSCATNQDCAEDAHSVCVSGLCKTGRRVFVSSGVYTGNLGGVAGADQKCQGLADAVGLGGTFKAWLNGATASIGTRFSQDPGPYIRAADKALIAVNWVGFVSSSLSNRINKTELGETIGNEYAFTNAKALGNTVGYHCAEWTSTSGNGSAGFINATDSTWTDAGYMPCNLGIYRLYCVEQ